MIFEGIESNPTARLIVCERTGRWAIALRRELADAGVRVWETRTLAGCLEEMAASPASFVVLEIDSEPSGVLQLLARQQRDFPAARLAIACDSSYAAYEPLTREAGAVHFVDSPRRAGLLARLACRHLAQTPSPRQSLTESIWSSLPWTDRRAASQSTAARPRP
ncbi:MAG: hypothetical protein ABFC63_08140 [Thermoguttaceae bacterium]